MEWRIRLHPGRSGLHRCRWWRQNRRHSACRRAVCRQSRVAEKLIRWLGEGSVDLATQGINTIVSLSWQPHIHLRVLGLEVGLALQSRWQIVEAERQLPLEGRVFLAEGRKSPEGALTHQLLDGRVAARDGVRPAGFWSLHGGCCPLRRGGGARWEGRNRSRLVFLLVRLVIPLAAAALLAAGRIGTEGALAYKRGSTGVKRSCDAALLLPALLPLQTGGKGTADCVAQSLSRVFESHEAVAHPPPGGAVSADVREGLVIVAIRGAE